MKRVILLILALVLTLSLMACRSKEPEDAADAADNNTLSNSAPLVNPNLAFFIMDEHEDMVAMGVAAPSIAEALKKSRGKYFPTGWIDLLKAFRKNDTIDLLLIAVRPDYQKKGVNAMILYHAMLGCFKLGIKEAETGPMLETNEKVQSQWKDFDIEQHKRRRCFIKKLK